MAAFNLWCDQQTLSQALHFSGKNVRLSSLSSSKTFFKTEHSWTNTILSRGGRRKLLNSSLINKLIRIEWVSEWSITIRLPIKLMDVTSSMSKKVPIASLKYNVNLQRLTKCINSALVITTGQKRIKNNNLKL